MPIFSGTIQEGTCADGNRNGTHVAGTISANTNTPHLSGIAAVIRARYSTATASAIVGKLDGAVDDLGRRTPSFGRVNLLQAATDRRRRNARREGARARPSCVRRASRRAHR